MRKVLPAPNLFILTVVVVVVMIIDFTNNIIRIILITFLQLRE